MVHVLLIDTNVRRPGACMVAMRREGTEIENMTVNIQSPPSPRSPRTVLSDSLQYHDMSPRHPRHGERLPTRFMAKSLIQARASILTLYNIRCPRRP